ncbi:MAG: acyl-CoA desaturase [Syntrophorhabdales bacterium]|jgi:linoleoyl-CoA desaturase
MSEKQDGFERIDTNPSHYPPTVQSLKFGTKVDFQVELHRRVDEYFRRTGRPRRGGWRMYLKSAIILSCFFLSYLALVFWAHHIWQGLPLAVLLAFSTTGIGFSIQHDGGHRAFSERRWVNRLAAMTMDLIGVSSYVWHRKHALIHHNYVNITGWDADINIGSAGRLSPYRKWLWFHRWQHLYLWVLYGFLVIKMELVGDFIHLVSGRIHGHRVARPKGWDLVTFVGGKLVFCALAFAIPIIYHSPWIALFYYAVVVLAMGTPLSAVFQLPHAVKQADFPLPNKDTGRMENPWAVHQTQVTLDFDRHSPVKTWFLGGLNFHIEHHLFPSICHVNYPGMSKVVEETCREFGLRYGEHRTFWTGLTEHYRWLREMGNSRLSDGFLPLSRPGEGE